MFYGVYEQLKTQAPSPEATGDLGLPLNDWPITLEQAPSPNPASLWQLSLSGAVAQPTVLSHADLLAMPQTHQRRRLVSTEGWTYKSDWEGVLLKHLLPKVTVAPAVQWVKQTNSHGQSQLLPLKELLDTEALLCLRQGPHPLSPWHGGPIRLLVFNRPWQLGLPQLTRLEFLATVPTIPPPVAIEPGKYYAFDLKTFKPIDRAGEVTYF